jgi:hypothetical protein
MSSSNEDQKPMDNMELLKQQASDCAPGCACPSTGSMGRKRVIVGTLVLLVVVALVARAVIKTNGAQNQPDAAAFALPTAAQTPPAESAAATPPVATAKATDTFVAKEIGALAELNTVAAANDAVFVYVPGKNGTSSSPPAAAMQSAAKRIGSQGLKIGLFTLRAGTRDYDLLTAQMSVPGVLAAFKGRGMSATSGDITETKLIQAFVAASSAGGCGAGGCGPAGCGPVR